MEEYLRGVARKHGIYSSNMNGTIRNLRQTLRQNGISNVRALKAVDSSMLPMLGFPSNLARAVAADCKPKGKPVRKQAVLKLFSKYESKGEDAGTIVDDELERLFEDVGIRESEGHLQFALFYKMKAKECSIIQKQEFIDAATNLGCSKVADLKKQVDKIRREFKDNRFYTPMYKYVFGLCLEEGKYLDPETAISTWDVILSPRWRMYSHFKSFVEQADEKKSLKVVDKDLWNQIWDFARDVRPSGSNWDDLDDGSWHSQIDSFVDYLFENNVWTE